MTELVSNSEYGSWLAGLKQRIQSAPFQRHPGSYEEKPRADLTPLFINVDTLN